MTGDRRAPRARRRAPPRGSGSSRPRATRWQSTGSTDSRPAAWRSVRRLARDGPLPLQGQARPDLGAAGPGPAGLDRTSGGARRRPGSRREPDARRDRVDGAARDGRCDARSHVDLRLRARRRPHPRTLRCRVRPVASTVRDALPAVGQGAGHRAPGREERRGSVRVGSRRVGAAAGHRSRLADGTHAPPAVRGDLGAGAQAAVSPGRGRRRRRTPHAERPARVGAPCSALGCRAGARSVPGRDPGPRG